jgi:dihydroneopterin aldolase
MPDRIVFEGLRAFTTLGVHEHERRAPREVRVDLDLEVDLREACASDRLDASVDYDAVARAVSETAAKARFRLVEALAEAIARAVLAGFPRVARAIVRVTKPGAVEQAASIAVEIGRKRGAGSA